MGDKKGGKVVHGEFALEVDSKGSVTKSAVREIGHSKGEPPFVKLYLDNVLFLSDMPKGLSSILYALLERMPYGVGKGFAINAAIRREIATELGITEGSVRNAITKLTQGTLLIRKDTGLYMFNPHFFGKGDWKDIEYLRLEICYDYRGRTFMAEVKHKKQQKQIEGQQSLLPVNIETDDDWDG